MREFQDFRAELYRLDLERLEREQRIQVPRAGKSHQEHPSVSPSWLQAEQLEQLERRGASSPSSVHMSLWRFRALKPFRGMWQAPRPAGRRWARAAALQGGPNSASHLHNTDLFFERRPEPS